MCVIFFYVNSNPTEHGYKLILASNRDEFYARDTLRSAQWNNTYANYVCGGTDLEPGREGGTWLALSEHDNIFKIGALLNLTGEPKARNANELKHTLHHHSTHPQHFNHILNANINHVSNEHTPMLPLPDNHSLLGRGMIVSEYVDSVGSTIEDYNNTLLSTCTKYNAFNFVSIEIGKNKPGRISLCSNVPPSLKEYCECKCYGFGNSLPDVPFEKVRFGQQSFENIVNEFLHNSEENDHLPERNKLNESDLIKKLQSLLKCEQKHWPDTELKRRAPNWGEGLSALNVKMPDKGYGSRTHTITLIDSQNRMQFVEETMASLDPDGEWILTHLTEQF